MTLINRPQHTVASASACAMRRHGAALALLAGLCSGAVQAQEKSPSAPGPAQASKSQSADAATVSPGWHRLSVTQKQALAPLAGTWDTLSKAQQRKWLELSKNYPQLAATEQAKMHERMTEWVALTPQERAQARLNFGKTTEIAKELSPAEKLARWQAYQALSAEERQKLADHAKTRPLGAAPAVKPVPAQKLAVVPPVATAKAKPVETPAAAAEQADSN